MRESTTTTASDTSIMMEVSNGNVPQLGILFDRHHRQLFSFFLRLTGSPALSEDLVQEVFLRILKYRRSFRPNSQFTTWMYQIARNARIDHTRKHGKDRVLDDTDSDAPDLTVPPVDPCQVEAVDLVRRAMDRLPAEKREVLILARFHGLRHQEIGRILDCEPGTVRVRLFRALRELRRVYFKLTGEKMVCSANK